MLGWFFFRTLLSMTPPPLLALPWLLKGQAGGKPSSRLGGGVGGVAHRSPLRTSALGGTSQQQSQLRVAGDGAGTSVAEDEVSELSDGSGPASTVMSSGVSSKKSKGVGFCGL